MNYIARQRLDRFMSFFKGRVVCKKNAFFCLCIGRGGSLEVCGRGDTRDSDRPWLTEANIGKNFAILDMKSLEELYDGWLEQTVKGNYVEYLCLVRIEVWTTIISLTL